LGLGVGFWAQYPNPKNPNPQSPIPNNISKDII